MKDLDVKKLAVFIAIIVVVVGGFFLVRSISTNGKLSKEESETVENLTTSYFVNLTQGYSTIYSGIDILYSKDKVTTDDIEYGAIINTAIKYAIDNDMDLNVPDNLVKGFEVNGGYGSLKGYIAYNGEVIQNIIKKLFGDVKQPSVISKSINYMYNFIYDEDNNIYFMKKDDNVADFTDINYFIDYNIIKKEKNKDDYKITLAIAYAYNNNGSYTYYKDANATDEVASEVTDFPKADINEFDHFTITLKKVDNDYIFDKIEKVN